MIITVGTYADIVALKAALGPPKALFYRYLAANPPSPEQANVLAIYEGELAFKTGTLTSPVTVPTPSVILGDFPEAVELSSISYT